jgi:hypothetical protein
LNLTKYLNMLTLSLRKWITITSVALWTISIILESINQKKKKIPCKEAILIMQEKTNKRTNNLKIYSKSMKLLPMTNQTFKLIAIYLHQFKQNPNQKYSQNNKNITLTKSK